VPQEAASATGIYMASELGSIRRLILGDLADAPERVRERMLESIPTTTLSLAFYSITLFLICGGTMGVAMS